MSVVVTAAISVLVETGQWHVSARNVSPYDILLNAVGAGAAAIAAVRLSGARRLGTALMMLTAAAGGVVFGVSLHGAATVHDGMAFRGWDGTLPVVVASEVADDQPSRAPIGDRLACSGGGMGACASPGAPPEQRVALVRSVLHSQHLALSARLYPSATPSDELPIVIFAQDPEHRILTLKQVGTGVALRVQTPRGRRETFDLEFVLPGAVVADERTDVRGDFGAGVVLLSARNERESRDALFRFGLLESWLLTLLGRGITTFAVARAAVATGLAMCLPLGAFVGWLSRDRARAWTAIRAVIVALVILAVDYAIQPAVSVLSVMVITSSLLTGALVSHHFALPGRS
jgi:VanZ family protein